MRIQLMIAISLLVLSVPAVPQEKPKADEELTRLAGTWNVVSFSGHGQVRDCTERIGHDGQQLPAPVFTITGDQLTTKNEVLVFPEPLREIIPGSKVMFGQEYVTRIYRLQLAKSKGAGPGAFDLIIGNDVVLKGIYELKGDDLKLCVVNRLFCNDKDQAVMAKKAASAERPKDYTTKNGGKTVSFVLTREKK